MIDPNIFPDTPIDFRRFSPRLVQTEDLSSALNDALDTEITSRAVVFGGDSLPPPLKRHDRSWINLGIEAAQKTTDDPLAILAPKEEAALEAIVRLQERPALLIRQDSFPDPPDRWTRLNQFRADISIGIPKVGRIDTRPGEMAGTGFVVAEGLIMTNRHVVEVFADEGPVAGSPWAIRASARPTINFKMEYGETVQRVFRITEVVAVHPLEYCDLALLAVEREAIEPIGATLSSPVCLASQAPKIDARLDLDAIGYPFADNGNVTPPEVIQSIYEGIFQVKRLQPGELNAMFDAYDAFSHDCSTLGGNSGSLVVDLASNQVIGLHFKGAYRRANYAVALWKLKDDPLFQGRGVHFFE
jgi:glutamyl endopeptidase